MRHHTVLSFLLCAVGSVWGCGDLPSEDIGHTSAAASTVDSEVTGYTRSDGVHAILFVSRSTFRITELAENPFGNGVVTQISSADALTSPWGYVRSDGVNAVVYIDSAEHVHEVTQNGSGQWTDIDFTSSPVINAPLGMVSLGSATHDIMAYVRSDGRNAIVYRGLNDHVYEIASNVPSSPPWGVSDLTLVTGGPDVGLDGPVGYVRTDGVNSIVYTASDLRIHEIASNVGGSPPWIDNDLFVASGASVPAHTGPWPYVRSDNVNSVLYVGSDNPGTTSQIYELSLKIGTTCGPRPWCVRILPTASNPNLWRPTGYVQWDGVNAVAYVTSTGVNNPPTNSLRMLSWRPGKTTTFSNVLPTGIPFVSAPFGHRAPGSRSSILYAGDDLAGEIHGFELSAPSGVAWQLQEF
jgi:hypothetical protein